MNFFGVGLPELAVIFAITVIVLGPERIPEVAAALARAIRFLRGFATDATGQLRAELSELTQEYDAVRRELAEFRQSVTSDIAAMTKEVASLTEESDRTLHEAREAGADSGSASTDGAGQTAAPDQPIVEPGGDSPPAPQGPDAQPRARPSDTDHPEDAKAF